MLDEIILPLFIFENIKLFESKKSFTVHWFWFLGKSCLFCENCLKNVDLVWCSNVKRGEEHSLSAGDQPLVQVMNKLGNVSCGTGLEVESWFRNVCHQQRVVRNEVLKQASSRQACCGESQLDCSFQPLKTHLRGQGRRRQEPVRSMQKSVGQGAHWDEESRPVFVISRLSQWRCLSSALGERSCLTTSTFCDWNIRFLLLDCFISATSNYGRRRCWMEVEAFFVSWCWFIPSRSFLHFTHFFTIHAQD